MTLVESLRGLKWSTWAAIVAAACLAFSYHPLLQLGETAGVHIDLSLLYFVMAIAIISSLAVIYQRRDILLASWPLRLFTVFVLYVSVSGIWSSNPFRAVVTALFWYAILLIVSMYFATTRDILARPKLIYLAIAATLAFSVLWAWWQIIGDALGISASATLLPAAYSSDVFGVARPTAFTLEPQFFASLLIAPLLWAIARLTHTWSWLSFSTVVALAVTLLMTLSRGGIFAAAIGAIMVIILLRPQFSALLRLTGAATLSVTVAILAVFAVASLNQRDNISGASAVSGVVSQLSFGKISLDIQTAQPSAETTANDDAPTYVESSTDSRLSMGSAALELWQQSPKNILFGVGIGGFGAALFEADADFGIGSVVNNYYLELLVETGIVGLSLYVAFIATLVAFLLRRHARFVVAILIAVWLQMFFFSGNANILHIWVLVGLAMYIATKHSAVHQPKSGTI